MPDSIVNEKYEQEPTRSRSTSPEKYGSGLATTAVAATCVRTLSEPIIATGADAHRIGGIIRTELSSIYQNEQFLQLLDTIRENVASTATIPAIAIKDDISRATTLNILNSMRPMLIEKLGDESFYERTPAAWSPRFEIICDTLLELAFTLVGVGGWDKETLLTIDSDLLRPMSIQDLHTLANALLAYAPHPMVPVKTKYHILVMIVAERLFKTIKKKPVMRSSYDY